MTAKVPAAAEPRATGTQWFVQVGAFKDPAAAKRVAVPVGAISQTPMVDSANPFIFRTLLP